MTHRSRRSEGPRGSQSSPGSPPSRRTRYRKWTLLAVLAALPGLCMVFFTAGTAEAHGAPMDPGSRTYLCWEHSRNDSGAIEPTNPACQAALDAGGSSAYYNWFAVLRSDGAGRTEGFIPDGQLCSGGTGGPYDFSGFNLARDDWPYTHLTSGGRMDFAYNAWAAHPGTFHLYVTKDGYDPTQPLGWGDLEDEPFLSVTDPALSGQVGTVDGKYTWNGTLPSGKSGKHLIYMVWERSDSQETFYSCSDVVFDGGNGEVTVPGDDGSGDPGGEDPGGEDPGGEEPTDPGACTAAVGSSNSWGSGHQSEVTVTNTSDSPVTGWTVHFTLPSGQTLANVWNGTSSSDGSEIYVENAQWNGQLEPGASASFGYQVDGGDASDSLELHCMPH